MASNSNSTASQEELVKERVPLSYRDNCSSLLLALNASRRRGNHMPWNSEHERHAYEKCQYDDYIARTRAKAKAEANNF